jgi:D-arabinose 1-dehydrogenase-like Zn-dependent alcohol dehydrogenase
MTSSSDLSVSSLFDFKNHVVLVTGGATGLGEMAAQAFVQNGARVFIASRKESELKKVRYDCVTPRSSMSCNGNPVLFQSVIWCLVYSSTFAFD